MKSREPIATLEAGGWWAYGLLAILMVPTQVWLREPVWVGDPERHYWIFGLGGAYVVATIMALLLARRFGSVIVSTLAAVAISFGALYAIVVLWLDVPVSKGVAGVAVGLSVGVIGSGLLLTGAARNIASAGLLVGLTGLFVWGHPSEPEQPAFESKLRGWAYHRIRVDYYNHLVPEVTGPRGGGFKKVGDAYVRMTGSGKFFRIRRAADGRSIVSDSLPLPSPLVMAAFDSAGAPRRNTFRALDFATRTVSDGTQFVVSHHFFHPERSCFVVRISTMKVDQQLRPLVGTQPVWQPLYETRPCLPLVDKASRRPPGIQLESGGRLEWLEPDRLLIAVGDHSFDGWNHTFVAAQADSSDYGRTLILDLTTGAIEVFTLGQRNPQGLHIDQQGRIWSTEHGPQGGDELNLLVRGKNYGWPYRTDGTDYGRRVWPILDQVRGDFEEPVLSWVPSIGVSEVISVPPGPFSRWVGDLLVASLREGTLYRVGLAGDRAVHVEPLPIERRIRDIVAGPDGSIWLWTDTGDLVTLSVVSTIDRAEEVFAQCAGCHLTEFSDESGTLAPTLRGVFERRVASLPDFNYSTAFRALGGKWTAERLDQFLRDPEGFAPGTTMTFQGVPNAEERAVLIEYLRGLQ